MEVKFRNKVIKSKYNVNYNNLFYLQLQDNMQRWNRYREVRNQYIDNYI